MDAYAAGLIDGEGYIGIVEASGYLSVRLKISMTDKGRPALNLMAQTYGGKVVDERPADEKCRQTIVWRLSGRKASEVLKRVAPWLTVKREIAALALEFQHMVDMEMETHPNGRKVWTDQMRHRARVYRERIKEMNRRGPDPAQPAILPLPVVARYRWGAWWQPQDSLFGPVEFEGTFPTWGRMVDGYVYATEPATMRPSASLLPTPHANAATGAGTQGRDGGPNLQTAVQTLTD